MSKRSTIDFHTEEVEFKLHNSGKIATWLRSIIIKEKMVPAAINYIFCNDDYLHKINLEYLAHDTLTDIITFNYNEGENISADIFISIERVRENSAKHLTTFDNELARVMSHGILHLLGYDDKDAESQATMRAKEDFYLTLHPSEL